MFRLQHVTTIVIIPPILFAGLLFITFQGLLNNVKNIDKGILAYSNCAINMMNYAFTNPNQIYNFSQCYNQELNNIHIKCNILNNSFIECYYNNESFVMPLSNITISNTK